VLQSFGQLPQHIESLLAIREMIDSRLYAIDLCYQHRLIDSVLVLMYSLIDHMASLDREQEHEFVTRQDFISWADEFLVKDSGLPCTAVDLYAARCGILHACSAEASLIRRGEAAYLYHAWGPVSDVELQCLLNEYFSRQGSSAPLPARAVQLEDMLAQLRTAIDRCLDALENDSERRERVLGRGPELLTYGGLPAQDTSDSQPRDS